MPHDDLEVLLGRLDRIVAAIQIGCDSVAETRRDAVLDALVETCWESLRVGHTLTQIVAYDDIWNDLDALVGVWRQIDAQTGRVGLIDTRAVPAASLTRTIVDGLGAVAAAVDELDDAQLLAVARPRDREALQRATTAISALESAADRFFVEALSDDVHGRLDAALAVLTTVAARAARERATSATRRA